LFDAAAPFLYVGYVMFISDEEASSRLKSSQNVLNVINKGRAELPSTVPSAQDPPELPSVDEVEESLTSQYPEIEAALEAPDGKFLRKILGMNPSGRKLGIPNMPREIQAAVATTAQVATITLAAETFGTSVHHAHELKHGYTNQASQYGGEAPDKQLAAIITQQKKQVRDLAFEKLTKALGLITDDKLILVTDVVKLSRVARDLSGVVEKVLPKEATNTGGVHFHVWRPEMREESSYETIPVSNR
jgi:hypothetical protein